MRPPHGVTLARMDHCSRPLTPESQARAQKANKTASWARWRTCYAANVVRTLGQFVSLTWTGQREARCIQLCITRPSPPSLTGAENAAHPRAVDANLGGCFDGCWVCTLGLPFATHCKVESSVIYCY